MNEEKETVAFHEHWTSVANPMHEGRIAVLVVKPDGGLGIAWPGDPAAAERALRSFQVNCCCGWRSRRFAVPSSGQWACAGRLVVPSAVEEAAQRIWARHCEEDQGPLVLQPASGAARAAATRWLGKAASVLGRHKGGA